MAVTDILLLHGFSGSGRSWAPVVALLPPERYRPLAPDLPGHGTARDRPADLQDTLAALLAVAPPRFVLAGYSLGGRIALHLAFAAPERVERLIMVSSTAGLRGEEERAARRAADERQARALESGDFEAWIERWRDQPLFADDPPSVRRWAMAEQRRQDPRGLAASLRAVGTGSIPELWDLRYQAIATEMAAALRDAQVVVAPGGHSLLGESPGDVAAALMG